MSGEGVAPPAAGASMTPVATGQGLRTRDEAAGYFYAPPPALVPAAPRTVDYLGTLSVAGELEGGLLLEGTTVTSTPLRVALRLVGSPAMLRCTMWAGRGQPPPPHIARQLPAAHVTVSADAKRAELCSGGLSVSAELAPFHWSMRSRRLCLSQDRFTTDPNEQLVVLPLGFTRLASGGLAYHDTFFSEPEEHFWGLGEKFTALDRRGQLICCWNHDALGCTDEHSYKNVPFFISSRGYGFFVDTTAYTEFDMGRSAQGSWSVVVAEGPLDYYVVLGDPESCLEQYQRLVGGPEVPPAWSFGTWVSTGFSAVSAERVRQRVDELERYQFPCDVLHLDTYWQRFGRWSDLAWDTDAFPDPAGLLSYVHAVGLRASLWVNPYIGVESPLFEVGASMGYFLRGADSRTWVGALWGAYHPPVAVLDLTNPEAVAWWSAMLAERMAEGADVFKTDFGEAVPVEVVAHDGTPGALLHNLYPLLYNDAVMQVMQAAKPERPVVWARSTWAGGQRHPVQWSGDSSSTWQDLAATLRAGLSMAMSGHHFWSHDIGGFHGDPSPELFVRWAQFGLLSPFSRFHGVTSRMPWDFGPEALAAVQHAAELRTRLFPYIYALAWRSAMAGRPIMRPAVLDYPRSADAQAADMQYLLGPDLLVAPCYRTGGQRPVWFPPGRWVHYSSGDTVDGPRWDEVSLPLESAPLWLRAGSVIPTLRPRLRIGDRPPACQELVVVSGASGHGATAGAGEDGTGHQKPLFAAVPLVTRDGPAGTEHLAEAVVHQQAGTLVVSGPAELADVSLIVVGSSHTPVRARFGRATLVVRHAATFAGAWKT